MSEVLVLLNPRAAGGRAGGKAAAVRDWLSSSGVAHRFEVPESVKAALSHLRGLDGGSRVVLLGGDGSLQPLLSALIEGQHVLGLVPLGSGNDLARAVGCWGLSLPEALSRALRGHATAIDTGELEVDGRRVPFASSLAGGFDAAVGLHALEAPRWLRGQARYLWATLVAVANLELRLMSTCVDGRTWAQGEMLFTSVLNTPTYGSGMPAVPHARLTDGRLNVISAGRFGRLGTLKMLPRLLLGRHLNDPRVQTSRFSELSVQASAVVPLAADGEAVGSAQHWRIRVRPGSLWIVSGARASL